jgi:hypothetical protein
MTMDFVLSTRDRKDAELSRVEQIYIGVASIREAFPEVSHVSEKVLKAFSLFPAKAGARAIKRFVRSFNYVQYGRVVEQNIPEKWYEDIPEQERENAFEQLLAEWQAQPDIEAELVEIRSRPQR